MKSILQRIKARFLISPSKRKQGVAILTVLAIITLMTVLVVSFFNMAQTAKITAKGSVEIQRVTTLKDTIINLVIAQFREASKLAPVNASNPREIVTWISQPGAIRTFAGNPTDTSRNRLYKLYSSDVPQIGNISMRDTAGLLREINKDVAPDWAERPDEFTDLNRPVYTAAAGDRARATGQVDAPGYSYPIVDPRAYNGGDNASDLEKNVEGFIYRANSGTPGATAIKGVDPRLGQLALPVRWIYILQDGTLGYLDDNKEFSSLNGNQGGQISRENPIVGRLAWWADDESCKINVNTASIPSPWDTPRTTSLEDQWLAQYQPIAGEFQRYPGHPATVDLCAVFYPNRRWMPPVLAGIVSASQNPAGGAKTLLDYEDALRVWDLAPFIIGDRRELSSGSAGTSGGTITTPIDATVGSSSSDRLFTSLDEVYFKATGSANVSLNSPRNNLLSEKKDKDLKFLRSLEKSQFFLTHKSHSPELTAQGFPRVSMFPMDLLAVEALKTGSTTLPTGVSPYDFTMALNSTIGGKGSTAVGGNAYFFQRRDPTSRHFELYTTGDSRQRNARVFGYLKQLSRLPIPGYPEAVPFRVPAIGAEDSTGLSFASKYPPAVNGPNTGLFASNGGSTTTFDSSERTQILLNMLDYTRSINMQPAFLNAADKYDDGNGMASGVCGCATGAGADTSLAHYNALMFTNQANRSPKGAGKIYGPAEIAIVLNVAATKESAEASAATSGPFNQLLATCGPESRARATGNRSGKRYIVEIGFIMSGFNPKSGWSPTFSQQGIYVSGAAVSSPNDPTSPDNAVLPFVVDVAEKLTINRTTYVGANTSRLLARTPVGHGILPYGGMGGPRVTFTNSTANNIAFSRPFVIIDEGSGPLSLGGQITVDPSVPLRIMPTDGVGTGNVVQAVDLKIPQDFFTGIPPLNSSNVSLTTEIPKYFTGTGANFPDERMVMRSFVVPHGDYRLTVTPLRVDPDMFVPVSGYNGSSLAHSFYELNSSPSRRNLSNASGGSTSRWNSLVGLMNPAEVTRYILSNGSDAKASQMTQVPFPAADPASIGQSVNVGSLLFSAPWPKSVTIASNQGVQERNLIFSHGRRDGYGKNPMRGSSDPFETGDFDTGTAALPDGPYMNYPDEGDRRRASGNSYFKSTYYASQKPTTEGLAGQTISPNFLVRSPVDFGSIPSGVANRVPWQTLRFRPDPGMNNPQYKMDDLADTPPDGMPFANFCGPKDHFFLDMFWMPVVEPWSISEPFSTKGTINLNQQIIPFLNVERTTALHALFRGERMYAIPNEAADKYKSVDATTGAPSGSQDATYRHFINAKETVRQMTRLYNTGYDSDNTPPGGNQMAFNVYRSASEICELWLIPEGINSMDNSRTVESVIGAISPSGEVDGFWSKHRLTGDNLRERPYANLYPRVTVRSNVFKLHMVAQTLQKANSQDPRRFDSTKDTITAEWRGSCMIERSIDPRDKTLTNIDYTNLNASSFNARATPRLDAYYTYRVTEVKQLTQ